MKKPAAETRQHILDVTRALMTQKGYTAVGLAEVVAAAGVPKGSFYYYFKSKGEFGQALLDEYFADYLRTVDRLLAADGSGAERLLGYFKYWADTQGTDLPDDKCLVVKLGPEMCDLSEDMRIVLQRGTDAIIERISRCVRLGQDDGSITSAVPAEALAQSLYELWLGASLLAKLNKATTPFDTAFATTQRLVG
ncbi:MULTISPECIES: TetR/AcrR family transcriptional regulator [unclassified Achromobacter]|uniref:TetR/AcrR family transcriptional regulator n=1 Tax=unclassified Achromobacter TaxID=2626865 RepID=UPI000ED5D813|nr:TetR/AcrR family transcriptional regulator [Achromobacter sp.]MDX3984036.1 TetR/AcrR family transcriptional regulator [Achromobacter sp.]HCQ48555.1 TetR family transcriptional regulator [Achromobacter sp.]